MIRTIKIQLEKSNNLIQTVRVFNQACQKVLDYGFDNKMINKTHLNRGTYKDVRHKYPTLPSALVQTARDQASDMLKRDKFKHQIKKKQYSSIRYDRRTLKVFLKSGYCSISTIFGRMRYDFKLANYYHKFIDWNIQNAQLIVSKGCCYLHVQVEHEDIDFNGGDRRLGIDLGINNIAVCSDNNFYNSKHLKCVKGRYQYLKSELQKCGTRSSMRKLVKVDHRERRFVRDLNHCLSKELVSKPFDIFVFENLTGIKKKNKGRRFNKKLGNWSFSQLQIFTQYKAEDIGKHVMFINPKNTSRTCSKCGFTDKKNRHGHIFKCKQCGFELNADLNASRNIATFSRSVSGWLSVNKPKVASVKIATNHSIEHGGTPPALAGGG